MSDSSVDTSKSMATETDHDHDPEQDRTLRRRLWRPYTTPWSQILSHPYKGNGTDTDPYVVTWLPVDPENPLTYGKVYKWGITIMAACGTLAVTMGSSALSAAVGSIKADFPDSTEMQLIMITGIYILGFVLGPFLWAPMSEVFGRRATYIVTLIPLTAFDAGVCGSPNLIAMLLLRFCAGTFGCSTMTNAGGIISDMFAAEMRGSAMGVFGAMPWLGPVIGPIAGGFLSPAAGWRWVAAVVALFAGVLCVGHLLFLPETYHPVLLRNRAAALSAATGKVYRCEADVIKKFDLRTLVVNQLKVPYILLFTEPIVCILSIYLALVFGILYMQFYAFPLVFQHQRGWSPGVSALTFIGMSVGSNLALAYMIWWGNPAYSKRMKENGYLPPEARLPSAIVGAIMLPLGLIIFAWTCVPTSIHWIVPVLATVPWGAGMVLVFLAAQNFLVDAYLPTAASVIAGGTVVRSIIAVILPLFTADMYKGLGIHGASSLTAGIAFIFIPMPIILMKYGQKIRRYTKYGRMADDLAMEKIRARREAAQNAEAEKIDAEKSRIEHEENEARELDGVPIAQLQRERSIEARSIARSIEARSIEARSGVGIV